MDLVLTKYAEKVIAGIVPSEAAKKFVLECANEGKMVCVTDNMHFVQISPLFKKQCLAVYTAEFCIKLGFLTDSIASVAVCDGTCGANCYLWLTNVRVAPGYHYTDSICDRAVAEARKIIEIAKKSGIVSLI